MTGALLIAFLLGVFGFVVAHRLTTSLRRTGDLVGTVPVGAQQRTLALCLACLVPAAAGVVFAVFMLVTGGDLAAGRSARDAPRGLVPLTSPTSPCLRRWSHSARWPPWAGRCWASPSPAGHPSAGRPSSAWSRWCS